MGKVQAGNHPMYQGALEVLEDLEDLEVGSLLNEHVVVRMGFLRLKDSSGHLAFFLSLH